ncbi:MAG: hypothetical protein M3279_05235, partial [Actinomycetota bacterium]|nr:hypothetical protein [Actinomycetota bacterium]
MTAREWDRLPAVDRVVADEMPLVVDHDATRAALSSHARPDPLLGSLGHTISPDGPGGIVWGLPVSLGGPPRAAEPAVEAEPFELPARSIVFERPRRTLAAFGEGGPEELAPLTKAPARDEVFRSLGRAGSRPEEGAVAQATPPAVAPDRPEEAAARQEPNAPVRPRRFKGVLGPPLRSGPGEPPGAGPLFPAAAEPWSDDVSRGGSPSGGAGPRPQIAGSPEPRPRKESASKPLPTSAAAEAARGEQRMAGAPSLPEAREPRPEKPEVVKKPDGSSPAAPAVPTIPTDADEGPVLAAGGSPLPRAPRYGKRHGARDEPQLEPESDERPVLAHAPDARVLEGTTDTDGSERAPDVAASEVTAAPDTGERPILAHAPDATVLEG